MNTIYILGAVSLLLFFCSVLIYFKLNGKISLYEQEINNLKSINKKSELNIDELNSVLMRIKEENENLKKEKSNLLMSKAELEILNSQIPELKNEIEELNERFGESIKIREEQSVKIEHLETVLNKERKSFEEKFNVIENAKNTEIETLNNQISELKRENQRLQNQLNENLKVKEEQSVKIKHLETVLDKEKKSFEEKLNIIEDSKKQLTMQFENLANEILKNTTNSFIAQNKEQLSTILNPFKSQISEFKSKVEELYVDEAKERSSLKNEIENLRKLNEQISLEAENLTNALKKDVKSQGNWGEIKLEMILEASGMRKGLEYEIQSEFKDNDGSRFRPDVIIKLPENRHVVIDSKVSLTAYEKFVNAKTEKEKNIAIKEHINSLKKHIKELSEKDYASLYGINSLDFVLMFVYNEASYIAAIDYNSDILQEAFKKKILIVAPFTLYGTLRIIHHLWKYDEQNKNARLIADKAAKLYDKFVGFLESVNQMGSYLQKTNNAYDDMLKKLSTGRGNILSQTSKLKDLGVMPNKQLPENFQNVEIEEE
jgi:DNA recombination protein RmuC